MILARYIEKKIMNIKEYTDYLMNCNFTDDTFDPEDHEDHLKASWELFENYPWEDIYPVWMRHLHESCHTPADVINFVNLYVYYDAISILSNHGLANMLEDPYYDPTKDERILSRITALKNNAAQ